MISPKRSLTTTCAASLAMVMTTQLNLAGGLPNYIDASVVTELALANNVDTGVAQKHELIIQPEIKVDVTKDWQLTSIARFRTDAQNNINPDSQSDAELREFYFESTVGDTFLTLGKQQIVWGKADGLKVLDVVNPQDFREFILDDFDSSRIPLWTINAEIPFDETVLQLLVIPDQTYHEFADRNAQYSFTSPLVSSAVPNAANVVFQNIDKPDRSIQDSDFGLRVSSFWRGWDISFNYLYHYDDIPVFFREIDLSTAIPLVTIKPEYERTHLLGSSFSNAFGSLTLRGEFGYSFDRYFSINDLSDTDGVIQSDELAYVLGFDWSGIEETFISFQFFQTVVIDDGPGLIRDQMDTTLTFLYKQEFMNDSLVFETLLLHNLNSDDGLVRPKIKYEWQDNIIVSAGVDVFYGNNDGLYGQFDNNDRIVVSIEWGV